MGSRNCKFVGKLIHSEEEERKKTEQCSRLGRMGHPLIVSQYEQAVPSRESSAALLHLLQAFPQALVPKAHWQRVRRADPTLLMERMPVERPKPKPPPRTRMPTKLVVLLASSAAALPKLWLIQWCLHVFTGTTVLNPIQGFWTPRLFMGSTERSVRNPVSTKTIALRSDAKNARGRPTGALNPGCQRNPENWNSSQPFSLRSFWPSCPVENSSH